GPRITFDLERDIAPDMHVARVGKPQTLQGVFDGAPLRIEDPLPGRNINADLQRRSTLDPAQHFLIRAFHVPEVAPEAILVELGAGRLVPEAAGVGTDFIAQQNFALMATELELEINQNYAALVEKPPQHLVDLERELVDGPQFRLGRPSEQQ